MITRLFCNVIARAIEAIDSGNIPNGELISVINLAPPNSTLSVYVYGRHNKKYRFIYEDNYGQSVKKFNRVLLDRMPMTELRTGIHDSKLTEFAGTPVRFFR